MERIKFKKEWREAAKRNKISHKAMITILGIEEKKFSNLFYGLTYIPDDLVDKVNEMVVSLLRGTVSCDNIDCGHFELRCKLCGRVFDPWGADKDMENQVPICPQCYNERQAIDARKRKLFLLNEGSK